MSSAGFIGLAVMEGPRNAAAFMLALLAGIGYYYVRRALLARGGESLDEILRSGATAEG